MNHRLAATLAVATVALHATAGHAQPDGYAPHPQDEDFDTLIITGTRIPTPASQEGRSVSIVTADDIELRQQRFLFDALTAVPGVQVTRSGSFGALASVSIRGLSSSQTLAVQDGIVLNNPATFDNSFNFANFDTSDIERIEVIRGAQSTLYGSDAIGGVINIVTKDGRDGLGGAGFLEGGSFGSFRGAASLYGGSDVLSGRATISGTTTSGFSSADAANGNTEDDGFDTIAVSAKGRYQLASRLQFEAVLRYQDSKNEFDSFTFQPVDGDEVGKTQELTVGGFATLQTFAGKLGHRASVSYTRVDQLNLSDGIASFDSLGTRIAYEYQATAKPVAGITLVAGAEYDVQESQTRVGFGGNQKIKTSSGYGLLQVQPHERVTLSAGVRYDTSGDFGSETTLSGAGAVKLPLVGFVLRGSYSEGFRAPTAGELGFNPNLFAEFGTGWDIGLSRALLNGRVHVSATYFSQHVRDLIAFDLPAFTFINIQRFKTSGVETAADIEASDSLSLHFSYTYLDAFNVSTTLSAGNQPDHRASADIAWRPTDRLTLSAGIVFNGKEPSFATTLDRFTLVNLRGEYALNDVLGVFARVENATDKAYQDNAGFGTAPLAAFGGVRMRY